MDELKKAALTIAAGLEEVRPRSLLITSAVPGEGVTTVALELAQHLRALLDLRPLVVELNFARPSLMARFSLDRARCLEAFAAGRLTLAESAQEIPPGIAVLPLSGNGVDSLSDGGLEALLSRLLAAAERYDLVLVDTAPVLGTETVLAVSGSLPRAILVVAAGRTRRQVLDRAKRELASSGIELTGAILNFHRRYVPQWFYQWLTQ